MTKSLSEQFDEIVFAYDTKVRNSIYDVIKKECKTSAKNLFNAFMPSPTPPRNPQGLDVINNPKYYKRRPWLKYTSYWAYRTDKKSAIINGTIYVKAPMYRLAHLLEFGHVLQLKNGGTKMVRGFGHVKIEEKRIVEAVDAGIKEIVKNIK